MSKPKHITITERISESAHTDLCYLSAEWRMPIYEVIELLAKEAADEEENKAEPTRGQKEGEQ